MALSQDQRRIRAAIDRLLSGQIPSGGSGDAKALAHEVCISHGFPPPDLGPSEGRVRAATRRRLDYNRDLYEAVYRLAGHRPLAPVRTARQPRFKPSECLDW